MRIAITADTRVSLFSNGINQNAIYIAMLYIDMGHTVHILGPNSGGEKAASELTAMGITGLKIKTVNESIGTHYDLLITVGLMVEQGHIDRYKQTNPRFKFVSYKCGNELFTDMETILYNAHEKRSEIFNSLPPAPKPDAIWSIPQMENTNLDYYSFLLGTDNATVVPFIWDPMVIEGYAKTNKYTTWQKFKGRFFGIMEPNISFMKNLLVPIMIMDRYLNQGGKTSAIHMFSAKKLSTNKRLLKLLKDSKSSLIKKVTAEDRMPTMKVLHQNLDCVVSWQIENNLNYLYFDIAWMGYPIIHNANLCQDVGYYYEGQDTRTAVDHINYVFENHDKAYKTKNRKAIKRFTRKNPNLAKHYAQLTSDVMNNNFKKYSYDWKTNSIK